MEPDVVVDYKQDRVTVNCALLPKNWGRIQRFIQWATAQLRKGYEELDNESDWHGFSCYGFEASLVPEQQWEYMRFFLTRVEMT